MNPPKRLFFRFGNFWWLLVHFTPVPFLFKPGVFAYFLNMYIFLKSLGIFLMHCWGWGGVPQTRGGGTDMATGCFCAAGFGPGSPVVATALSMSHRCHLTVDLTHGLSCKMSSHSKCDNSGDTGWWPVPSGYGTRYPTQTRNFFQYPIHTRLLTCQIQMN